MIPLEGKFDETQNFDEPAERSEELNASKNKSPRQSRNLYILRNQMTLHSWHHLKKKPRVAEENEYERNPHIFGELETVKMRLRCH